MQKDILVVGEKVTEAHRRQARNMVLADAQIPVVHTISVDDLIINDLELDTIYGDGTSMFTSVLGDDYYLKLAEMHIKKFGHVVSVVFDKRSQKYCQGTIRQALIRRAPLTTLWIACPGGQLELAS